MLTTLAKVWIFFSFVVLVALIATAIALVPWLGLAFMVIGAILLTFYAMGYLQDKNDPWY